VSETLPSESARHARAKTQAQKWGETAVAFIASATATGIFGLLSYVLWPYISWLALTCLGLAAIAFVILAFNSFAIIKWWIIIAKRSS
jgi:hypothetical protein